MPILESRFAPHPLLRNGHLQTIMPAFLPRGAEIRWSRERITLADGDFLDLDWWRTGQRRLAILSHGLEGNSQAVYMKGMAWALHRAGWDVLGWNYRGCSGEANLLPRSYHSGVSDDLGEVIQHAAANYDEVALVGFSLGGNITLKYLGEGALHPKVKAGVAISAPVHLASSARALDQRWDNGIYLKRFLDSLVAKIESKARIFPEQFDITGIRSLRGFQDFDDRYTGPMHGFLNADDYWTKSSSRQFLPQITVPSLLINAQNDPFLPSDCFPIHEAEQSAYFHLEMPESGGHVGFWDHRQRMKFWSEHRTVEFLEPLSR